MPCNNEEPNSSSDCSNVRLVVTGFGPFGGVDENPSNMLIRDFPRFLSEEAATVTSTRAASSYSWKSELKQNVLEWLVIETSSRGAQESLTSLATKLASLPNDIAATDEPVKVCLVHMGVNVNATGYQIEQCAYNDASFRIPDERGFQPNKQSIPVHGQGTATTTKQDDVAYTKINVPDLVEHMQNSFPAIETKASTNPGRFVCNYLYYASLMRMQELQQQKETQSKNPAVVLASLFVHIPSFDLVPQFIQLEYMAELLQQVILMAPNIVEIGRTTGNGISK